MLSDRCPEKAMILPSPAIPDPKRQPRTGQFLTNVSVCSQHKSSASYPAVVSKPNLFFPSVQSRAFIKGNENYDHRYPYTLL